MTALGKTTVLADMEDINETKQLIEEQETSMNEQFEDVDTDMAGLQQSINNNATKISALETEMTNVKKSVSDGKKLVANAITNKGISTAVDAEFATMAANIANLSTIAGLTADATITSDSVLNGAIGYGKNGARVVGSMPNNAAVSATLAINGSYTIPKGFHNGSGKVTQSLTTKAAATITPGTSNQTIAANQYLTGIQTILGDADLVAGNIRSGVNIFGVAGTYDPVASFNLMKATAVITPDDLDTVSSSFSKSKTVSQKISVVAINASQEFYLWIVGVGWYYSYYNVIWVHQAHEYTFTANTGLSLNLTPSDHSMNVSLSTDRKTITMKSTFTESGNYGMSIYLTVF